MGGLFEVTLYVPIIAILDIWKTTQFNEGESVVYDGFKYVWPVKGKGPRVVIPKLFAKKILFWKLVFPWVDLALL